MTPTTKELLAWLDKEFKDALNAPSGCYANTMAVALRALIERSEKVDGLVDIGKEILKYIDIGKFHPIQRDCDGKLMSCIPCAEMIEEFSAALRKSDEKVGK